MLKFLALGDSYTVGEGLSPAEAWPWQLVLKLRRKDVMIAPPEVIATTGWTSGELIQAMEAAKLQPPYDLVTLLIGVNNQYRGLDHGQYQTEFAQLLQQAITLAGGHREKVIVLSIPDWGVTPFAAGRDADAISAEIREFNRINARIAYREKVQYLNITEISRQAKHQPTLLAADRLHYSGLMYARWAEELLPKAWRALLPGKDIHIPLLYQNQEES